MNKTNSSCIAAKILHPLKTLVAEILQPVMAQASKPLHPLITHASEIPCPAMTQAADTL